MAHKKAGGSSRNGRDSGGQRLGVKLFGGNYEINQMDPQNFSLGLALQNTVPNPFAGQLPGTSLNNPTISRTQSLRPLPDYLSVATFANHGASSIYHSLQATLQRRYSKGLSVLVSYTNSKLINDSISNAGGGSNNIGQSDYRIGAYNRRLERGLDPNDISQRLVISNVYELPFARNVKSWPALFLRGWQVNSITTIQTGDPLEVRGANNFTGINWPDVFFDPTLHGDERGSLRWFNTDAFRNPVDWTIGNAPRSLPNTRGPGMFTSNLSFFKTFKPAERMRIELRAEAFNVLNHVNLNNPNLSFSPNRQGVSTNPNFGRITSAGPARRLQFGLRISF